MTLLDHLRSWLPVRRIRMRDLPGILAVLPVLRAQIADVTRQMEEAVTKICGHFSGIASQARKAVQDSGELLAEGAGGGDATVEKAIETSRTTIGALLGRLENACALSAVVVERMEQMEQAVSGIEALLAELQKIAFSDKIVALNAKIEAVHVGHLGSGFEVVADEITRQADRSNELADLIGGRVREMRDRVNAAVAELRISTAQDREKFDISKKEAEGALDVLLSMHHRARASLSALTQENTRLADEIAGSVVQLQYQDRVSQCLNHVTEALEKIERNLGGAGQQFLVLAGDSGEPAVSLLDHTRAACSMDSERAVVSRALQEQPAESAGDDIELF